MSNNHNLSSSIIHYIDASLTKDEITRYQQHNNHTTACTTCGCSTSLQNARIRKIQHLLHQNNITKVINEKSNNENKSHANTSCKDEKKKKKKNIAHLKGFASHISWKHNTQNNVFHTLIKLINQNNISTIVWDGDDYNTTSFTYLIPCLMLSMMNSRNKYQNNDGDDERPNYNESKINMLLQFIAFKCKSQKESFHDSWCPTLESTVIQKMKNNSNNLPLVTVILVDDDILKGDDGLQKNRFECLGIIGLLSTQSQNVFAIGGGDILRLEYEQMMKLNKEEQDKDEVEEQMIVLKEHVHETDKCTKKNSMSLCNFYLINVTRIKNGKEEVSSLYGSNEIKTIEIKEH